MIGRKKIKLGNSPVKENKREEKCLNSQKQFDESACCSSSCETDKFPLCHLPNEVLLSIYSYLSPVDLAAISELKNQRLRDLTFCIKEANFSWCHKAGEKYILAFFNRSRVKHIKKLNFNYTLCIKPQVLVQLICRCKTLTVLSAVECGIKFHHLIQILNACSQLEELSWDVEDTAQALTAQAKNLKTVYLFCDITEVAMRSVYFVIRNFVDVKNVWINSSSDSVLVLPFIGMWLTATCIEYTILERRYVLLTNSYQCLSSVKKLQFLRKLINNLYAPNPRCIDSALADNTVQSKTFMSPPYLQFSDEDTSQLQSEFSRAFTTVSLLITSKILDVSQNLVKSINEVAGDKLKHLSLINEAMINTGSSENPEPISVEESLAICDTLETLFFTCQYITTLNLVTVHFSAGSPFKAISKLKYLRILVIPSCAFFKDDKEAQERPTESENVEFKDVVTKCASVEDFSLFCCADDHLGVTDSDLFPLQEWKELKYLAMYSVSFRTCSFLKKVANSCKKLQRFSFITVAPKKICLFIPDVIYLLKNAKNLTFIRINVKNFNPMYERFWNSIGEAVNLEGICIMTELQGFIKKSVIVNAIKRLKYLYLFHFVAPRVSDSLYFEVRKSIQDHGIVNYSVERSAYINTFNSAATMQYYHQQPHYCCQRIHLKDF